MKYIATVVIEYEADGLAIAAQRAAMLASISETPNGVQYGALQKGGRVIEIREAR